MRKIAVCGGIGSGKSSVCQMFAERGVAVYDSDSRAKSLMSESAELRDAIVAEFGEECYEGGMLNRSYLASKVFGSAEQLAKLNSIVHPAVKADFLAWAENFWHMKENIIYRYKKDSKDKKAVNIRPGVYTIVLNREEGTDNKHAVLDIIVQSGNDGNIRPEEVAYGLMNAGMPLVQQVVRIHRTGLYALDDDGNMITPLQAVN